MEPTYQIAQCWTPDTWYHEGYDRARASAVLLRSTAQGMLGHYRRVLPGLPDADIGKRLADSNQRRLAAMPDLTRYPELRSMRDLVEAEWRGVKDGAELDDILAAVYADANFYLHRNIRGGLEQSARAQCSTVYFHASDHGALLAFNFDVSAATVFGPPEWPQVNKHLVAQGASSGVFLDEESPEIFPAPVMRLVGRYCRTTDDAVEMLTRYNLFWGPLNLLLADRQGNVAMIEKTACRIGVRIARDGFGFVTAMTAEHPEIHAFLEDRRAASLQARGLQAPCVDTCYWELQDRRRSIMNRLLAEAKKAPTFESMRALMQYRGPDGMVADNGEILLPGGPSVEHTVKTEIFCLGESRAAWWARDHERNIPSWERRMPDVQFDDIPSWP